MGKSCTNEVDRVTAARHGVPAIPEFGNHLDLNHGGILLTLPSLLACGLLNHIKRFAEVGGYYTAELIFFVLAFLSLLRLKNLEQSRCSYISNNFDFSELNSNFAEIIIQ